ncbi:cysteine--tRNA ligase [Thermosulfuriphilus sp.]
MKVKKRGNILDLIGNTPLVPIRRLNPNPQVTILAKLEGQNPGGSVKDRIALSMIEAAEESGELSPEKIIIEATSGNTGIGLAMVAAVKGYRCLLVMSESASVERRKIMRAYGAEIFLTPAEKSTDGAIEEVYARLRAEPERYFCPDQFNNENNWRAHYHNTAPEIWRDTEGRVTHIIATMGTTGTLMGLSRFFRERAPQVQIIGVEPYYGHKIQGLKNMKESYKPGIFDRRLPHRIVNVHDEEAFEMARLLARKEGIFVGMSAGAAMAAAHRLAREIKEGLIVAIFPDGGERYLSTSLFSIPEAQKELFRGPRFYNTLSRKKEPFVPQNPPRVGIYSCGPTAYELAHLGLCRRVVVVDLLKRLLEFRGYEICHVMNITDIDDKTIAAAQEAGVSLESLTDYFAQEFLKDVDALRAKRADYYPRAREHIEEMITITKRLLKKGMAYVKYQSVYFDISKLSGYGQLSRVDLDKIQIGKTVDLDDYDKDSPVDFTLFKRSTLPELKKGIFYQTEWGNVRPGWHIECVAMAMKYLGEIFDIHTSGTDLIFPHHENEIAIAQALTGKPLAKYWLHSALVYAQGQKMSRSAGNVVTLRDLLAQGFSGREVRFFILKTHYRKPLNFSYQALKAAVKALRRIDNFIIRLTFIPEGPPIGGLDKRLKELKERVLAALEDDLNVSLALGHLFSFMRWLNSRMDQGLDSQGREKVLEALKEIDQILAVMDFPERISDPEVEKLIQEREEARKEGNYQRADQIRQRLLMMGVEVIDAPFGPIWRRLKEIPEDGR